MKRIVFLLVAVFAVVSLWARQIELNFPNLGNCQVQLYYWQGIHVDTLSLRLDEQGKGVLNMGNDSFRGMVRLDLESYASLEFVVAEPLVVVYCDSEQISFENCTFNGSHENFFLKEVSFKLERLKEEDDLLHGVMLFFTPVEACYKSIVKKRKRLAGHTLALERRIQNSPLYGADFMSFLCFMQHVDSGVQNQDSAHVDRLRNYLLTDLNIASIYAYGPMWENLIDYWHVFYMQSLLQEKQPEAFAQDVIFVADKQPAPLKAAFVNHVLFHCQISPFDWSMQLIVDYANKQGITVELSNHETHPLGEDGVTEYFLPENNRH